MSTNKKATPAVKASEATRAPTFSDALPEFTMPVTAVATASKGGKKKASKTSKKPGSAPKETMKVKFVNALSVRELNAFIANMAASEAGAKFGTVRPGETQVLLTCAGNHTGGGYVNWYDENGDITTSDLAVTYSVRQDTGSIIAAKLTEASYDGKYPKMMSLVEAGVEVGFCYAIRENHDYAEDTKRIIASSRYAIAQMQIAALRAKSLVDDKMGALSHPDPGYNDLVEGQSLHPEGLRLALDEPVMAKMMKHPSFKEQLEKAVAMLKGMAADPKDSEAKYIAYKASADPFVMGGGKVATGKDGNVTITSLELTKLRDYVESHDEREVVGHTISFWPTQSSLPDACRNTYKIGKPGSPTTVEEITEFFRAVGNALESRMVYAGFDELSQDDKPLHLEARGKSGKTMKIDSFHDPEAVAGSLKGDLARLATAVAMSGGYLIGGSPKWFSMPKDTPESRSKAGRKGEFELNMAHWVCPLYTGKPVKQEKKEPRPHVRQSWGDIVEEDLGSAVPTIETVSSSAASSKEDPARDREEPDTLGVTPGVAGAQLPNSDEYCAFVAGMSGDMYGTLAMPIPHDISQVCPSAPATHSFVKHVQKANGGSGTVQEGTVPHTEVKYGGNLDCGFIFHREVGTVPSKVRSGVEASTSESSAQRTIKVPSIVLTDKLPGKQRIREVSVDESVIQLEARLTGFAPRALMASKPSGIYAPRLNIHSKWGRSWVKIEESTVTFPGGKLRLGPTRSSNLCFGLYCSKGDHCLVANDKNAMVSTIKSAPVCIYDRDASLYSGKQFVFANGLKAVLKLGSIVGAKSTSVLLSKWHVAIGASPGKKKTADTTADSGAPAAGTSSAGPSVLSPTPPAVSGKAKRAKRPDDSAVKTADGVKQKRGKGKGAISKAVSTRPDPAVEPTPEPSSGLGQVLMSLSKLTKDEKEALLKFLGGAA